MKKTERDRWAEQQAAHGAEGRSYGEHTEIVEPAISREDENESGGDRYARGGAGQGARSRHAKHHARCGTIAACSLSARRHTAAANGFRQA
jgi:hypothetical protein